jgi:hypothetical protein
MRCKPHGRTNCSDATCRRAREGRQSSTTSTYDALSDPNSALHQATYGGSYYGSGSTDSSSDCGSSTSSSSSDSGSSSCGGGE